MPRMAAASSIPYTVGTKNGLVVTWLTKTKFHSGVSGKFPAPEPPVAAVLPVPPEPPAVVAVAPSLVQALMSPIAAVIPSALRKFLREGLSNCTVSAGMTFPPRRAIMLPRNPGR